MIYEICAVASAVPTLFLPILPALQLMIDASPCSDLTYLINDLGRAFTDAGFGNKFRDWCDRAGLHHCTAHGLRKDANNGATSRQLPQLMAIFGWDTLKEAERYTRAADQQRLAEAAMHMLEAEQNDTALDEVHANLAEEVKALRIEVTTATGDDPRTALDHAGRQGQGD